MGTGPLPTDLRQGKLGLVYLPAAGTLRVPEHGRLRPSTPAQQQDWDPSTSPPPGLRGFSSYCTPASLGRGRLLSLLPIHRRVKVNW